jgi:hypothetical protein
VRYAALEARNDRLGQLQNCAIRCNIKTFLHWTTLVSRIPFTHDVIRELASQQDAGALNALAQAAAVEDQFIRRTAIARMPRDILWAPVGLNSAVNREVFIQTISSMRRFRLEMRPR